VRAEQVVAPEQTAVRQADQQQERHQEAAHGESWGQGCAALQLEHFTARGGWAQHKASQIGWPRRHLTFCLARTADAAKS
jgi:hypothetical protein